MHLRLKLIAAALPALFLLAQACTRQENENAAVAASALKLPGSPFTYDAAFPAYAAPTLRAADNTPTTNAITNDGATLGPVLFYDKALSQNNTVSCASCHKQAEGFGDNGVKSQGFNGGRTLRHFALRNDPDGGINGENRFKSGSLRNIAGVTSLFHNGTIPNVAIMLGSTIPAHGIPPQDRAAITAFLQTLTDNSIATDERFSDPFRK